MRLNKFMHVDITSRTVRTFSRERLVEVYVIYF